MSRQITSTSLVLMAALIGAGPASAAVVAPYSNDFTSSASDFTLSTAGGGWTLDTAGTGTIGHSDNTAGTSFTAAVQVTNLGGPVASASDFTVSGVYIADTASGTSSYVSIVALAGQASFPSKSSQYLVEHMVAVSSGNPSFRLVKDAETSEVLGSAGGSSSELRDMFDVPIRVTLSGTYVDTNSDGIKDSLDLVATWTRLDTDVLLATITVQDTSPYAGQYFGIRDSNANSATMTVAWDSFSVVPEPAGAVSLLVLGGMLLRRRGR